MSDRKAYALVAFVLLLVFAAMLVDASVRSDIARGDDAMVCQEDEVALPVDHHTDGAIEDAAGVSRLCVPVDNLSDEAYALGFNHGYDSGYGDAAHEAADYYPEIACAVVYVWPDGLYPN